MFSSFSRWALLAVMLVVFSAVALPLRAAQALDPLDVLDRTLGLVAQGDVEGARTTLASLADPEAGDVLRLTTHGTLEMAAGQYAEASARFRAALGADPQNLAALWGLSLCLLQRAHVYEAAACVGRAAVVAPGNARVKALQAYVQLQLGQLTDAAITGKAALDCGEKSPFLMATLAQIHYKLGYPQKAVEFSGFAAKYLSAVTPQTGDVSVLRLPLTMTIADTPEALSTLSESLGQAKTPEAPVLPLDTPVDVKPNAPPMRFQIVSPARESVVKGLLRVQAIYRGRREISFVVFQVDGVLRGTVTELPYHFLWDAASTTPGPHRLVVRAYDAHGLLTDEDAINITSAGGKLLEAPDTTNAVAALQARMMALTMPSPALLPLFTSLGMWHLELKEYPQAVSALEKSAALDPTNDKVLQTLGKLYTQSGLHALSTTGEITRGPIGMKRVAVTFDDGPNPLYTPAIMEELAKYEAHATFFVVGKMVRQYPDLALDLLANGHELANHTYNHPNLTKLSQPEIIREVLLNRSAIKEVTGRDTYLFRPPGGNIDEDVTRQLRALDYNIIYWSINVADFKKSPPPEQAALVLAKVQDGSILLMHNGPIDGTMNILPTILAELHRRGYAIVTVSDLMKGR
jgi:peptidoglycan/xylan/chitin deacetylase (PgdA/CDA1 family)